MKKYWELDNDFLFFIFTFFIFNDMNEITATKDKTTDVVLVPEYYYAIDIDYLTHMIGKFY